MVKPLVSIIQQLLSKFLVFKQLQEHTIRVISITIIKLVYSGRLRLIEALRLSNTVVRKSTRTV